MGPRAHDDDDASSNSSASVRSSNHDDTESPKSRIGQYRGKQYYIFDEEGLPYDPWFDLRSSKTLPLLKLLADEEHLNALSKTTTGRAEIADLFIKNLPPLSNHFDRWKSVEQPKEVWMLLYHVRTLFRRLSPEQSAMYVPIYGWFKPSSDPEFQDLYAGPNWEIPSELKYIRPVTPPPAPKWPPSKPKSPMASSLKIAPAPLVVDSSSSREATPARAGPSVFGPSVRFPTPVGPQQRRPMPPVASPVPVARGKPMQGSKAAEVLEEIVPLGETLNRPRLHPVYVKPKIAPAKGPSTRSKKNPTAQSTVEPPAPSIHSEDEQTAPSTSKGKSTAKGKGAFKSASVIDDSESDTGPRQSLPPDASKKRKFQASEGESEAPTPEKGKGKKTSRSKKKPKGGRIEDSASYAPELKSDSIFDQAQKPDPAPGYLGFFDKPLSAYPRSQPQIDALPKDEQWFFNPKANTQNSFIWAPDDSTPNALLGHPWWPSLTAKYKATNGPPVKDKEKESNRGVRLPPLTERFQQLPPLSKKEISDITLKLLEDPGFSCLECILFNQYCEFRGWNFQCTTCESQKRKGCSFRSSELQLERFRLEAAPWFEPGHLQIFQRIADMQAAFIRAHRSQQIAAEDTLEFEDKFRELVQHANKAIEFIGAEQFESRFTPDNSTPSMRDRMAVCVEKFNKSSASLSARHKPEHVASFNSQKSAHDDNDVSGFKFPSPKSYKDTIAAPEAPVQEEDDSSKRRRTPTDFNNG
ncbi:hypothetical protein B0H13DRAFT_1896749 [Mycena leptocephala]|nr:hypothetical protein B0H13DRAFT_1896749 [Mycena leptocephala]